jgi:hypothetical protein
MDQRIYHGDFSPSDIARSIISQFNRGNYQVQQIGSDPRIAVQIATQDRPVSGGQTALSIDLQKVADGVAIQVSQQTWLGVAASLGFTAINAMLNPWSLLGRLNDIAQDVESIQLTTEVWKVIDETCRLLGTGQELSERLQRMVCDYCGTANPVGEPRCIACGAPLGNVQPVTCHKCGFVVSPNEHTCPNCGNQL